MDKELDRIEEMADRVLSPERGLRWGVRLLVLIVLVAAIVAMVKAALVLTSRVTTKVEEAAVVATVDRPWFVAQLDAIKATDLEEAAAREALERHKKAASERLISRESDRHEESRLNSAIVGVQTKRLDLIRVYNKNAASVVDPKVLEGLPRHLELGE